MSSNPRIILGTSSTQIYKNQEENLILINNNNEMLTIGSNGNIGINNSSPEYKLDISGDLNVRGDLYVQGNTVTVESTNLNITNSVIKLSENNQNDILDSGFYIEYTDNDIFKYSGLIRDANDKKYKLFHNLTSEPTNSLNTNSDSFEYADMVLNNIEASGDITTKNHFIGLDVDATDNTKFSGFYTTYNKGPGKRYAGLFRSKTNDYFYLFDNKDSVPNGNNDPIYDGNGADFGKLAIGEATVGTGGITCLGPLSATNIEASGDITTKNHFIGLDVDATDNTKFSGFYTTYNKGPGKRYAGLFRDKDNDYFYFFDNQSNIPSGNSNPLYEYGNVVAGTIQTANDIIINGKLGIGTNSPSYNLQLSQDSAAKPTTSTWSIASDERVKTDIIDADLDICYNDIKNMKLRKFKWSDEYIEKYNIKDKSNLGFIAQEVEKINKNAINTYNNKDFNIEDFKSLNKDQLIMSLFGAVKKLQNQSENNIDTRDIIDESIYEKFESFNDQIELLKSLKFLRFSDKHNNKKQYTEEDKLFYYGLTHDTIKNHFNYLYNGENYYLPTVNRYGKLIDNIVELYSHNLKENDIVLVKIKVDNIEYKYDVKVTKVLSYNSIEIDDIEIKKIKDYKKKINRRKIFFYGKKIKNFNYLNLKFLYSLSSLSLSTSQAINKELEKTNIVVNKNQKNISTLNQDLNQVIIKNENSENLIKNIGKNFNKLVKKVDDQNKVIQTQSNYIKKLLEENNKLKQEVNLNKNNISLLNQNINKQNIIINQILQKINK